MESTDLCRYTDRFYWTIRVFAEANIIDLGSWHITDVPEINKCIAGYFERCHTVRTGKEQVKWFETKCSIISNLSVYLRGYIFLQWWDDSEQFGTPQPHVGSESQVPRFAPW
jgi:hypothetical protein